MTCGSSFRVPPIMMAASQATGSGAAAPTVPTRAAYMARKALGQRQTFPADAGQPPISPTRRATFGFLAVKASTPQAPSAFSTISGNTTSPPLNGLGCPDPTWVARTAFMALWEQQQPATFPADVRTAPSGLIPPESFGSSAVSVLTPSEPASPLA